MRRDFFRDFSPQVGMRAPSCAHAADRASPKARSSPSVWASRHTTPTRTLERGSHTGKELTIRRARTPCSCLPYRLGLSCIPAHTRHPVTQKNLPKKKMVRRFTCELKQSRQSTASLHLGRTCPPTRASCSPITRKHTPHLDLHNVISAIRQLRPRARSCDPYSVCVMLCLWISFRATVLNSVDLRPSKGPEILSIRS